jgi:putative DNA primase/helicase
MAVQPRDHDQVVVDFPATAEEERAKRIMTEAKRLASLSPGEWAIWIDGSAERLGITRTDLEKLVRIQLREKEKHEREKKAEERRIEQRAERRRADSEKRTEKQADAEKRRAEKEADRERRKAEKEAEKKQKEKAKRLGKIMLLPVAQHEKELQRLAERLDEDVAALREEFAEFLGVGAELLIEKTEPWPEPVDTVTLLRECGDQICRYVVLQEHQQTAAVLWAAHCWLYDHDAPTYSPILAPTSAEPDSGKTTLVAVVGRTAPRFSLNIEMTGPSLYRFVDAVKPTLVIDEADDLFVRKSDLKHIINAGWTRGAKIPRQVNIDGAWVTVYFDPFTPKAIALLGRNLPPSTRSRSIELRILPKRVDEKVEEFKHVDDAEFAVLRRKFTRWAADNTAALKAAKPTVPSGLNNRAAMNWTLLLAIAEMAGDEWPERAREAAERLTRKGRLPSDGVKLLTAIKTMFAESGKKVITSKAIVAELAKDPTDIWVAYNHGGTVTQRQIAHLLSAYDITPDTVHPSGRSSDSPKGYKREQFTDTWARYLPDDPHIRTPNRTRQQRKAGRPQKQRRKK